MIQYIKNENVNINIHGKKEMSKTEPVVSSTDEEKQKLLNKHQLLSLLVRCVKRC